MLRAYRIGPNASPTGRFHNCNSDQGISAGCADVYSAFLPCQYVVIDVNYIRTQPATGKKPRRRSSSR